MDQTDFSILEALQRNAREKKSVLAREMGIPATTLQERIRRLEKRGVIEGYRASINAEKLGLGVQAFIAVSLKNHESNAIRQFERGVADIPCVRAGYHLSGRFDYMLHVSVRDLEALGNLVKTEITTLPDFGKCETFLVFSEIQSNRNLMEYWSNGEMGDG